MKLQELMKESNKFSIAICGETVRKHIGSDCGIYVFVDDVNSLITKAYEEGKKEGSKCDVHK